MIIQAERVRTIRKVTPEYVASQRYVGQAVIVRKYGSDYTGRVTKVAKTRVTVEFATRTGKPKSFAVPAWKVEEAR